MPHTPIYRVELYFINLHRRGIGIIERYTRCVADSGPVRGPCTRSTPYDDLVFLMSLFPQGGADGMDGVSGEVTAGAGERDDDRSLAAAELDA